MALEFMAIGPAYCLSAERISKERWSGFRVSMYNEIQSDSDLNKMAFCFLGVCPKVWRLPRAGVEVLLQEVLRPRSFQLTPFQHAWG